MQYSQPLQERDGELTEKILDYSRTRSHNNQYEVYCGMCGTVFYTDEDKSKKFRRSLMLTSDNPFICDECSQAYEDLAYENR